MCQTLSKSVRFCRLYIKNISVSFFGSQCILICLKLHMAQKLMQMHGMTCFMPSSARTSIIWTMFPGNMTLHWGQWATSVVVFWHVTWYTYWTNQITQFWHNNINYWPTKHSQSSVGDEPMHKVGGAINGINYPRRIVTKFQMCVIARRLLAYKPASEINATF